MEDVRFTANKIGIVTDTDLISLANEAVTIDGKMTTTGDLMVTDNTKFAVYASNGNTVVGGTLGVTARGDAFELPGCRTNVPRGNLQVYC